MNLILTSARSSGLEDEAYSVLAPLLRGEAVDPLYGGPDHHLGLLLASQREAVILKHCQPLLKHSPGLGVAAFTDPESVFAQKSWCWQFFLIENLSLGDEINIANKNCNLYFFSVYRPGVCLPRKVDVEIFWQNPRLGLYDPKLGFLLFPSNYIVKDLCPEKLVLTIFFTRKSIVGW